MKWSDVTAPPRATTLRQFAGLCLIFFLGIAAWRMWEGRAGSGTEIMAGVAIAGGCLGLIWPMAIRWIYTAWMIAAFPIGWTISNLMLGVVFFFVFTPVAWAFKAVGRDALWVRRRTTTSYWKSAPAAKRAEDYLRQS